MITAPVKIFAGKTPNLAGDPFKGQIKKRCRQAGPLPTAHYHEQLIGVQGAIVNAQFINFAGKRAPNPIIGAQFGPNAKEPIRPRLEGRAIGGIELAIEIEPALTVAVNRNRDVMPLVVRQPGRVGGNPIVSEVQIGFVIDSLVKE